MRSSLRLRAGLSLLFLVLACATPAPDPEGHGMRDSRLAHLQRAATLPWTDGGRCAVREASRPWRVLAERCYRALDHDRIEFHDVTGRCAVASAGAAAVGLGVCVLAAPEIVVGAVIVTGVVVVGFALEEALDAYELSRGGPRVTPLSATRPAPQKSSPKQQPRPEPKGPTVPPLGPIETSEQARRRRCEPIPVPHRGGDDLHNECADKVPPNRYPGMDALVDGKHFDALQVGVPVLWEIKTERFDTYAPFVQNQVVDEELEEFEEERNIAQDCGYSFVVGVSTKAHRDALLRRDQTFDIVVTGCRR